MSPHLFRRVENWFENVFLTLFKNLDIDNLKSANFILFFFNFFVYYAI